MPTNRSQKRSELTELQAIPQDQLPTTSVSLKELYNERHRYETFPEFQRKQCWPTRYKQALIDTILLGDPIPPVEGYDYVNLQGEKLWGLVDGQQRILAILEFMDGAFPTWTAAQKRAAEPNSEPPVAPGKTFDQLSPIVKNYFWDYRLPVHRIRRKSETQMGTRFLRIQNQLPLSAAEKLNIYSSRANLAARQIEKHPFWKDVYDGKHNREQVFQSSLHLLALEMAAPKGIVDLQAWSYLHGLAAGKYDSKIHETLADSVCTRLDVVTHVYAGTLFTIRAIVVPMYQSIMFLERSGYIVQPNDEGKLTAWMEGIILESTRTIGVPSYRRPVQQLLREGAQREFWKRHYGTVMKLFGVSNAA